MTHMAIEEDSAGWKESYMRLAKYAAEIEQKLASLREQVSTLVNADLAFDSAAVRKWDARGIKEQIETGKGFDVAKIIRQNAITKVRAELKVIQYD